MFDAAFSFANDIKKNKTKMPHDTAKDIYNKNVDSKDIVLNLQPLNLGKGYTSYTVTYINTV